MTWVDRARHLLPRIIAVIAVSFGLVTVFAGGRVLFGGSDPGYVVFRPLLAFNTAMGMAYVITGLAIWRALSWGAGAAALIVALNLIVLGAIGVMYANGGAVAVDSLRAMAFRSAVWIALLVGLRMARHEA